MEHSTASTSKSKSNLKQHPYAKYKFNREEFLDYVGKSVAHNDSNYKQEIELIGQKVDKSIRREKNGKIFESELQSLARKFPDKKAFDEVPLWSYSAYWFNGNVGEKSCLRILNPWKPKTTQDEQKMEAFKIWKLIWELNIRLIVHLPPRSSAYPDNLEDKLDGVYQLLPNSNDKEQKHFDWIVKWKCEEKFDGFLLTRICLFNGKQNRLIQVLRLLNWPDAKSAKPDPKQFVNFMIFFRQQMMTHRYGWQQVAVYCNSRQCPAGLFFMCRLAMELNADDKLCMPEMMSKMIEQSIATSEFDYKFCYFALRDYSMSYGSSDNSRRDNSRSRGRMSMLTKQSSVVEYDEDNSH